MDTDEGLWPPFGPAAEFRHTTSRGRARSRTPGGSEPDGQSGRGPALSRDDIVAAAIEVADGEGADAVSMRKIAQVLRAGAMSLYWHLASKDHLLELMLDALIAEVEVPAPSGDWKADLRVQARSTREVLLRHRWVMDFFSARPPLGPNTLRNLDKSLATLDCLKIDTSTAINILQTVNTYVSGAVLREFQEIRTQREQERLALDPADFAAKLQEWRRRLAATGLFDHFLRILSDDIDPDAQETRTERFEFGLDCVLEGVAAKLAK